MNPNATGNLAEARVLAALLADERSVLLPFGTGARYDLAYDDKGTLVRIQVKSGRLLSNGAIVFDTCRKATRSGDLRSYEEDADLFGVFCVATDGVYLVPVSAVAKSKGSLRVVPARNNQTAGVLYAVDYRVA